MSSGISANLRRQGSPMSEAQRRCRQVQVPTTHCQLISLGAPGHGPRSGPGPGTSLALLAPPTGPFWLLSCIPYFTRTLPEDFRVPDPSPPHPHTPAGSCICPQPPSARCC